MTVSCSFATELDASALSIRRCTPEVPDVSGVPEITVAVIGSGTTDDGAPEVSESTDPEETPDVFAGITAAADGEDTDAAGLTPAAGFCG